MSRNDDPFASWIGGQRQIGEAGNDVFFGPDVLRGLVEGIGDFVDVRQERWRRRRTSPAVIACAPWFNDSELLRALRRVAACCVVVSKRPRGPEGERAVSWLRGVYRLVPGFPVQALGELREMALKVDGEPRIVGPYDRQDDIVLPPVRALGHRSINGRPAPMAHAKLALLGHLWWGEQDALGHPDEFLVFTARRLWMSSANFTTNSRKCLEFGFWTEDDDLMREARIFLAQLLAASESVDAEADVPAPDLATIEFDHEAMAEAAAEVSWDDEYE